MGRRKKSCHRKGNAAASTAPPSNGKATKTGEATQTGEATVANEEQNNNNSDVVLEQKLDSCQLSNEPRPWEAYKSKGNDLYAEKKHEEALEQYSLAIEALESDENAQSNYF